MQIAILKLEQGDQKECKKLLEDGKSTLDSMTDIDPSVYASYYWVSSQFHKTRQEFAEFYKSALLYLAYTSVESLSDSFKLVCHQNCLKCFCWLVPSLLSQIMAIYLHCTLVMVSFDSFYDLYVWLLEGIWKLFHVVSCDCCCYNVFSLIRQIAFDLNKIYIYLHGICRMSWKVVCI